METTEIRMITDLDEALPQSIAFNFEEVKTWLTENLASYKSMVVTEDEIGAAKADKAKISNCQRPYQNSESQSRNAIWSHTTTSRRK